MDSAVNSVRAGRYVAQPGGYRAFIPAPLPPADPPVKIGGKLQVLLSQADLALGRLDGSIQTLPNPDLFVSMYVRKEAVLSSQIEGTQSSLHDVLTAEAKVFAPDRPRDVAEVINYVAAMNHGLARLAELPLSARLIRQIHAELMRGVRGASRQPGDIRKTQNWIGPEGCAISDAVFIPPPPAEIGGALSDLERFLHADAGLPLLVKIGLAHSQFETIHPFLDGNGRIGRLLITFLLCEQKTLQKPALYLSHFFKRHRREYYERLQAVRDGGAWEEWLIFFVRGVIEVSRQATDTARRILALREADRRIVTDNLGRAAGNGHRVLEHLYASPIVSVADMRRWIAASNPAANDLAARLAACGILREFTGHKRNRRFVYQRYIDLFQDSDSDAAPR